MKITIRDATDSDSKQIRGLVYSMLEEYGLQPDPEETDKDLESIEYEYFSKGGYFC